MTRGPQTLLLALLAAGILSAAGCHLTLPETTRQPVLHNPFPQLSRVAVAPFFNQSDEPTVDGRKFAMAYFAELQAIRGFEVAPVGVVEEAILRHGINLNGPGEARRLAEVLGVDAVVIGTVTDFSPYYPPRCGIRVDWYAANPGFHPIPAGYGLPWGTPDEEYIPDDLVFEAEMSLAREQMKTQTPDCYALSEPLAPPPAELAPPLRASPIPVAPDPPEELPAPPSAKAVEKPSADPRAINSGEFVEQEQERGVRPAGHESADGSGAGGLTTVDAGAAGMNGATPPLPAGWPDARGFTPPGPCLEPPKCVPQSGPVMTHTRIYRGSDPDFTAALASYVGFRDDARFGGWQSYLERMDDFIPFCCHLHLAEMLTARGGGNETRVVQRWSESR